MTLGQTIRQARQARKLSLRALAAEIGVSAAYVGDVELGRRRLNPKAFPAWNKALGLPRIALWSVYRKERIAELEEEIRRIKAGIQERDAAEARASSAYAQREIEKRRQWGRP